ncbi:DNA repair protein recA homolog 2, mitochondrial isoform X1 [Morus notabilis]|uniref:DNA repair protein recA homolog 2, mitochondrial isoform X1 n=1 Tax=Morus notabilis TaxID=981085 RepID=UPI000CED01B4|nr:DNA repair protein recA homolog 2, mitochondrial isoform X1 [Morus notabilis]
MKLLTTHRLPIAQRLPLFSILQKGRKHATTSLGNNSRYFSSLAEDLEHDAVHDDAKATEKDAALHLALSRLSNEFGRESTLSLQRFFGVRHVPVIPTGSLKLDIALGIGGLPKGRFVEIYGQEASGKSTLALHIIKEAQKLGGFCAYFDVENAMDPSLVESMGVDTENLLISRPDSAENLLSAVDTLTKCGSIDVIVVDSVAALLPQCEIDVPVGGILRDAQSRIMSQALCKIHYSLRNSQTLIVLVNQVRSSSKSRQGNKDMGEDTCGGNALKFYSAVRLKLGKRELLKNENEVTGLGISVQVVKNKLAPAMKKAELGLRFGRGFCCESEVLELACEQGIIVKEGNGYLVEGKFFGNRHEAELHLAENEVVFDKMVSILRRLLFETEESIVVHE